MNSDEKKVRPTARPEAKTLPERKTAPTTPDGEAARVVSLRGVIPCAPLDIADEYHVIDPDTDE